MSDLFVIVPTRGRPESARRLVDAWDATGAFDDGATLCFAVDADDPSLDEYWTALGIKPDAALDDSIRYYQIPTWQPMVHKLDSAARIYAEFHQPFALGFAGDDHLPRTRGWAARYLEALRELGTGTVYGNDLLQGERLCTQWAMTSDIVRALGRMVPAPVEHMACDNSVMDLGRLASCLRYLPDVVIEHMHPLAGKAEWDTGYARVNRAEQYQKDLAVYADWQRSGMAEDVAKVREIRRRSDGPVRDGD